MSTLVPPPSAKRQRKLNSELQSQAAAWADPAKADAHLRGHAGGADQAKLVIQFRNANDNNAPLGPPINIPAGAGQRELALLVNQLRRQLRAQSKKKRHVVDDINEELPPSDDDDEDDEDLPYAFHVAIPSKDDAAQANAAVPENTRLTISSSIEQDVLASRPAAQLGWSTESLLDVVFEPQAVFRVRAVNRCSSSLTGHTSPILCSTFSPSGRLLLTGSGDRTARIWDLTSESPLHTLTGHGNWVLCAEWEPRERKAATGDMDGVVFVWDALDASYGRVGRKAWGARSGEAVQKEFEEAQAAAAAATSEDAKTEARKKMTVAERRAARHAAPGSFAFRGHSKWVTSLAWEPLHLLEDRNEHLTAYPRLASSSKDGTVRVWSLSPTRRCEAVLGGHTASVNVVRWGGEGLLYTASSDRSVRVWTPEGKTVRILQEHAHWVNTLALSTDYVLRTGPFDHLGEEGWERELGGGGVGAEPGSGVKGAKTEEEWESAARKRAKKRYVEATRAASSGGSGGDARDELLISGSDDHTLFLWPPQSASATNVSPTPKKPIARLTGHQQTVNHVAFSPSGTLLASASFDKSIKLWNARTGKFIATLRAHVGSVYRLTWSADSRLLVSASKDSTVKVWDVAKGKLKRDLSGHTDEVYCVDFAGDRVASGGRDRTLKIWRH
ncbi:ribosome assembly [Tilletia horrida]|uniref:Ribosome assembly n=1 Tax=Tilletia horrida TaxID=155126 RepID=A0AAN6G9U3_9BASI|nr:ribosome assembly [Tilletia horrida]